ncbi:hypothetical protein [Xanthomonas campestris]|uniref:hypothetical protein n=1 Tax=Xanthomonas campestris TaxID=339 RepID=UPI0025A17209|nr:hypothetical protein [Xanthomonas campestris]MDM7677080.1 hypothetical protein [Xanthomonas campestris pv. campestris]
MIPICPTLIGKTLGSEEIYMVSDSVFQWDAYQSKQSMEADHLKHLSDLLKKQNPQLAFETLGPSLDPPDFFISRDGVRSGIELTVWPAEDRIQRAEFFSKLQDKLLSLYESGRLRGLVGMEFRLKFNGLGGKPTRLSDSVLYDLVGQIEGCADSRPNAIDFFGDDSPPMPSGSVVGSGVDWSVTAVADIPFHGSDFANRTGFEISAGQQSNLSQSLFDEILQRVIGEKDKSGTDELLISVGAPNRNGRALTGDVSAISSILKKWKGLVCSP